MTGYYKEKLSGRRLQRCYEIAPPRVQRYLEEEIRHVLGRLRHTDNVLELGCGYGRVTVRLAEVACSVTGIDTSEDSLEIGRRLAARTVPCQFANMDAVALVFPDDLYDVVVCVQNGICAFNVDQEALVREALRVVRPAGRVMFSTYSDRFWDHRLEWFELQSAEGLVGPIDREESGDGVIVCTDGFRTGRMTPEDFETLCAGIDVRCEIVEVDDSSLFCEIVKYGS